MTLQLHKPDGDGGLTPVTDPEPDWRNQLQSTRWGTGLRGDRLPKLGNPEMNPTTRFMSVLFWLGLGVLTFLIIAVGYSIGFWTLA
jgi:hypothetical protein